MAIERDINKKKKEREPAQKLTPARPFRKQGLRSPTYTKRNPHRDSGDKKPSLKTKASIIKEKAKKGQGLARGGMVKSIIKLIPGFAPTPRSGTVSTIQKSASAFVKRRKQLGGPKSVMPIKKAMGGEAAESVARSKIFADKKARDRQRLMDMLDRLKKKPGGIRPKNPKTKKPDTKKFMERPILPKDKPKPKPIRPILPKNFKKPKAKRAK
tara:strand:+ start:42 stop:677 length:636 start_codon:yes stop_codon:yes gene_type:complete